MDQNYEKNEVFSTEYEARSRKFFFDLKKSSNGYFVKVSEKSFKGRSTIMFDIEDLQPILGALNEASTAADGDTGSYVEEGGFEANEVFSTQIEGRSRKFYVDLKRSRNGLLVKISEKSFKGRSTIMFDREDLTHVMNCLKEVEQAAV